MFKKGDIVKAITTDGTCKIGTCYYVIDVRGGPLLTVGSLKTHKLVGNMFMNRFELVKEINKKERIMNKVKLYRLIKDTPFQTAGAIYTEGAGVRGYGSTDNLKFPNTSCCSVTPKMVETQPDWFEEVFKITPEYATKAEIKALKLKVSKKKGG